MSVIATGILASLAAGMATVLGALAIWLFPRPSDRQQSVLLGFAAGVMLAASFFSLIVPALDHMQAEGATPPFAAATVVAAVLLGALLVGGLERILPPLDGIGVGPRAIADVSARRMWLFVAAVTLHNLPEGFAVGVAFGGNDTAAATATALGIGLQNIPEGLAVAIAVTLLGYRPVRGVQVAMFSGLVEPVGGALGVVLTSAVSAFLPWGLGIAAGAMIFVVASEVMPDIQRRVEARRGQHALMIGLATMMFLDVSLG